MAMTMAQASAAMREAMRETVKRYSTWYLLEGVLLVIAGVLALVYPYIASVTLRFCCSAGSSSSAAFCRASA
jgi:uncharacterized membrane protein HdeD (DUF308 family)